LATPCARLVARRNVGNWRATDDQTYSVMVRLDPQPRDNAQDLGNLPFSVGTNADGSPRIVRLSQVADLEDATGPNQINRRNLSREVSINANVSGRSAGEVSADIQRVLDMLRRCRRATGSSSAAQPETWPKSFGYAISALVHGGGVHLHDSGQPVPAASCSRWR